MLQRGSLEVICGSMFSGKSEELLRLLRRAEFAKQKIIAFKHEMDKRSQASCITSHDGTLRLAHPMGSSHEALCEMLRLASHEDIDVVGIDEVQFFPREILTVIFRLIDRGKRVIVAGLDRDFRGEPFGIVPYLMASCENLTKLRAICSLCSDEASFTQRLIDGKPAKYDDALILVGASECYQARCRNCFEIDKAPKESRMPHV